MAWSRQNAGNYSERKSSTIEMITVKFATGEEKQFNRDGAALSGPVFVLYRRRRGKLEVSDAFSADQIEWARLSSGVMVMGKPPDKSPAKPPVKSK